MTEITKKQISTKFSQVNFRKSHKILNQFDKSIKSYIKILKAVAWLARNASPPPPPPLPRVKERIAITGARHDAAARLADQRNNGEISREVNLILTWSPTCVINNSKGTGIFAINNTKLYVRVVNLSTQGNAKLL